VILTLRQWGVDIDEAFFLGGVEKKEILKAFNAHIFFDDQDTHVKPASTEIPSGRVPYKSSSEMSKKH
jgi:5'-nucleotidase